MISFILHPVSSILSLFTVGVTLIVAGFALGALAYLMPALLSRSRQILALASAACLAGGIAYGKGRADCEAKHAVSALQEQVRRLEQKAEIDARVRAADEATRAELEKKLSAFDRKANAAVEKVPDRAAKGCAPGLGTPATRGVQSLWK